MQQRLWKLGYSEVGNEVSSSSGLTTYGPFTEEAVRVFQTDHGLPVSGSVDQATWEKLFSALPRRR